MKVYEFFEEANYDYPEDMEIILNYLNTHGKVNVSGKTVERLYREYSDEVWSAGWMGVDSEDDCWLSGFSEWLNKIDC